MWRTSWPLKTDAAAGAAAGRDQWYGLGGSGGGGGKWHLSVAVLLGLFLLSLALLLGQRVWEQMREVARASPVHSIERVLLIDEISGAVRQLLPHLEGTKDPGPFGRASIRAAARAVASRLDRHRLESVGRDDPGLRADLVRLREAVEGLLEAEPVRELRQQTWILMQTMLGRLERRYRRIEQHIAGEIEAQRRATEAFVDGMTALLGYMVFLTFGASILFLHARRARERAAVNHRRLEAAIACLPDGFALYDAEDRLLLCNRRYREIFHRSAPFIRPGIRFEELLRRGIELGQYGDVGPDPESWIAERLAWHGRADGRPLIQRLADGRVLRITEHRTGDGDRVGLRIDITELEAHKRAIAASEARWRGLAETAPIGIWHLGDAGTTLYANPALNLLFGRDSGEQLEGRRVEDLVKGRDVERLRRFFDGLPRDGSDGLETVLHGADGVARHVLIVAKRLDRRSGGGVIATVLDITRQKRALAEVERLAMSDPLTGLANRHRLAEVLDGALGGGGGTAGELALMLVDLDGFKEINDSFGHEAGDRVLRAVAERLRCCARRTDLVARLGGDEFALVLRGPCSAEEIREVAARVMEAVARPIRLPTTECRVAASIGIAMAPRDGRSREVLLRHADLALYRAKRDGRGRYVIYRRALSSENRRRRRLTQALGRALENEEFELVFQPQVATGNGRIVGAEILLRWYDPVAEQPVSPAEFVRVAEESGLILELDRYVLRRAAREIAGFEKTIGRRMVWGINISAAHVEEARLVETVESALREHGLAPGAIELEVTENVFIRDLAVGKRALERLKELGVKLALDDFGTGYSSLAYLSELPFDRLKIDRSFIRGLEKDAQYRTIVRAIIGLGRRLGMELVAEGVESPAQRAFLAAEGCAVIQGYMVARPMPRRQFLAWLRDGESAEEKFDAVSSNSTSP